MEGLCEERGYEAWQAGTASLLRNFREGAFAPHLHTGVRTCSSELLRQKATRVLLFFLPVTHCPGDPAKGKELLFPTRASWDGTLPG